MSEPKGRLAAPRRRAERTERFYRRRAHAREEFYRRLLALYPKDHRREHAEEMVGVLLAAAGAARVRAPRPVAWYYSPGL